MVIARVVFKMHGLRVAFRFEVLKNRFGDKRNYGSGDKRKSFERITQRFVSFEFIAVAFAFPKSPARPSDIPVVELVNV